MASASSPPAEASKPTRRASSRVRKQTEHYTSSPYSTGKRKRGQDVDDEVQVDGDDVSDGEDVSEDASDEEEIHARPRKPRKTKAAPGRKPAAKKPRVNGISLPIRGSKAPAKKRIPKKVKILDAADAEAAGGLYAEIFAQNKQMSEVVAGWLKAFQDDESQALADLVSFVLKCAGCDLKVTAHDVEDVDAVTSRLTDLQDEHQATQPTEYPFIARGKNAAGFKQNVSSFIQIFTTAIAASGLLYESEALMDNIQVWFSTMTSATNRGFRHTSTVVSLSVITALCEVAKELAEKAAANKRQAETERRKSRANKERVKQIEQKAKVAALQHEHVEALLRDWFDVVFIHRYRDVDPVIRRDCIAALGDWMTIVPEVFFTQHHHRYLGWVLSDSSPGARAEDLRQLHRLYSDSNKLGGLKSFTERFRDRMVEIGTSDADTSVRIAGIELLDLLRENGLLEPDDIDSIGRLIFHDDLRIRKAVATFFAENVNDLLTSKLEEFGGSDSLDEVLPEPADGNFEAPRLEWLKFKSLAEMLQSYDTDDSLPSHLRRNANDGSLVLHAAGVESRFTLAVDVLHDNLDELRDWQTLAGYLLFDHSSRANGRAKSRASAASDAVLAQLRHECKLDQEEEIILLEVLQAAVRRTLNDLAEKVHSTKAKLTKRQKEDLEEDQEEGVRNLTDLIPRLLKKFGENPSTAAAVLRLETVLALPSLQSLRQDSATAAALLDDLKKQFMSHGTDEVLAPATAAILHAQSYGELDDTTAEKLAGLWEDVVGNLAELLDVTTLTVRGASRTEELRALSNNLLRIVRLSTVSNCVQPLEDSSVSAKDKKNKRTYNGAIDFVIDLVQRIQPVDGSTIDEEDAVLEDEVAARAAEAALFYFRWKLMAIINTITTGGGVEISYDVLEALAERRDAYVNNLTQALESRKASDPVSVPVTNCLLDLYTSSAILRTVKPKPGTNDDYTVLVMDFEPAHEKAVMKVFAAAEKEFAKLSNKRLETGVIDTDVNDEDVDADPADADPESDDDDEDDDDAVVATSHQPGHTPADRDEQLKKPLLAEQRLCQLTSKIIYALAAGVIDDRATRKRLERNRARLGPNFKEVVAYLDLEKKSQLSSSSAAARGKGGKGTVKAGGKATNGVDARKGSASAPKQHAPKSQAIVRDEDEDLDEDEDEDEEVEDLDPEDTAAALKRKGLDVEGDADEDEQMVNGEGPGDGEEGEDEEESVIGD